MRTKKTSTKRKATKRKATTQTTAKAAPPAVEKSIMITATIMPLTGKRKRVRKLIVSAARDGHLPHTLTGTFPDLHQFINDAYALAMNDQSGPVAGKEVQHTSAGEALPDVDQTLTAKE